MDSRLAARPVLKPYCSYIYSPVFHEVDSCIVSVSKV